MRAGQEARDAIRLQKECVTLQRANNSLMKSIIAPMWTNSQRETNYDHNRKFIKEADFVS